MTLDTQIALALTAPDTFDKVHKNIISITDEYTIDFTYWVLDRFTFKNFIHKDLKELLEIYKKEKGL